MPHIIQVSLNLLFFVLKEPFNSIKTNWIFLLFLVDTIFLITNFLHFWSMLKIIKLFFYRSNSSLMDAIDNSPKFLLTALLSSVMNRDPLSRIPKTSTDKIVGRHTHTQLFIHQISTCTKVNKNRIFFLISSRFFNRWRGCGTAPTCET